MHVGLGASLLNRGLQGGHLDGIAVYTQHLLQGLLARRMDVTSYVFSGDAENGLANSFVRFPGSFGLNLAASSLLGVPFVGSRSIRPSLFHATDHQIPRLSGVPLIATLMDPVPLMRADWVRPGLRSLKNWLFRRSAHWADHIIAISEYAAGDLVNYFGIPRERMTVIPLGVEERCFEPIADSVRKATLDKHGLREKFFLFIGTFQPRKNVDGLLEAYLSLPPGLRQEHPLVLVGRNGWSSERLIGRLKTLPAESGVKWLDYVSFEDKYVLLQSAQSLVFPSLYEGFGLPILEAFASGLPVIASNTTAIPEVAGDAAFLVDPLRTDELAAAMQKLVESPELCRELALRGRQRARELSWGRCVDRTIDLYRQMCR